MNDTYEYFINDNDIASQISIINGKFQQLNLEGFLTYAYHPLKVFRDNEGLKDLTTQVDGDFKGLDFDLEHPVDILPQASYDYSVNLILNDGKNIPRLINTRFSVEGDGRYRIVDRDGDNDTNIYDKSQFVLDTSLNKLVNNIVKLNFSGLSLDGNLLCGNYSFYFKLADADGNETDFVAESSIVSCHIGNINDPLSIRGGILNENSFKSANFILSNIDSAYSKVMVYYTRTTADESGTSVSNSYRILLPFYIINNKAHISITGFEDTIGISKEELNMRYVLLDSAKSQAQCNNILFLGNTKLPEIPYKDLQDLSLHFLPKIYDSENIGYVDHQYKDNSLSANPYEYYNAKNIYYRLGYWNEEIYRIGIVYILPNGELTPVFNVRGNIELTSNYEYNSDLTVYDDEDNRYYLPIDKINYKLTNPNENTKGLIRIQYENNQFDSNGIKPLGLLFTISEDAIKELKKLTKGFFFVRQKRLKLTLCQALTIGLDNVGKFPIIPSNGGYIAERFLSDDRELTHEFSKRLYKNYKNGSTLGILEGVAALCPEYETNQPLYNQFFTGTEFVVTKAKVQPSDNTGFTLMGESNYFYINKYKESSDNLQYEYIIQAVPDNVKIQKGKDRTYSSRCGDHADASKFSYCGSKNKQDKATNLIRGSFGPYIGLEGIYNNKFELLNIKIPDYSESSMDNYIDIRAKDSSEFYAISDRFSWEDLEYYESLTTDESGKYESPAIFRGDCFICNFTHRMNRNFLDPEVPINDEIVDKDTWKDNYRIDDKVKTDNINRGDVNAVKIGHWATFKVCSSTNLSFRCEDYSNIGEYGLTGKPRSFYPLRARDVSGESKIAESSISNTGYNVSVSEIVHIEKMDKPAYNNISSTRIYFSDISPLDSFINNYRVFKFNSYRDYPMEYGSIVKLIEYSGSLLCVFEHGIAIIPVQAKALISNAENGDIFLKQSELITDPNILSDTYGSQWPNSIIKTASGVYGVDTVAKKIWRIALEGSLRPSLKVKPISDLKVLHFLNNNITLTERENNTILGIRDVKTHYNKYKGDIMFTFYDNLNTIEECAWNLCFNENLDTFVTFYSWLPSFSENIDNIFFSFDRTLSKNIAKLYEDYDLISIVDSKGAKITEFDPEKLIVGTLILNKNLHKLAEAEYKIVKDLVDYPFDINENNLLIITNIAFSFLDVQTIPIEVTITDLASVKTTLKTTIYLKNKTYTIPDGYFWKHGNAGLFESSSKLSPTKWYGKLHPFEFEVVVSLYPLIHKIFTNLELMANKAVPESLHFEITGEVYNFAKDKENMFYRLEATKNLFQYLGGDIRYNENYLDVTPKLNMIMYTSKPDKSTIFPLYYSRIDTINEIEDYYLAKQKTNRDYLRMSGSEIIYDTKNREYRIATHVKGCPFDGFYNLEISYEDYIYLNSIGVNNIFPYNGKYYEIKLYGRLNGNMQYQEDRWIMQIPSLVFRQRNEDLWTRPPLNVGNSPLPETMPESVLVESLPENLTGLGYDTDDIDVSSWEDYQKEARLRDRYIRIKIRYSGNDLAVLYALKTLYTISYS